MFLKRLEIQGFKSFPEKIRLDFKKGITGIVGPNGSGKSNISDAIRWVLGEQSVKNLRGDKMEDVIFVGTKNRKPLGYAEVSIYLDNTDKKLDIDYSEVSITRKVYRSGESGYFINGTSCRLKDIYELFMDTGIGKEGYSIIGQGKIDAILSNKSEDRRALFEEAVGIIKFKNRKAKAEQKLEEVRQNLVRTNDIIKELENQLEPLFEQKEKAKKFIDFSNNLKLVRVNIFKKEYKNYEKDIHIIEQKIKQEINQSTSLEQQKNKIEEKRQDLKKDIELKEQKIESLNSLLYKVDIDINKKQSDINLANQNIDFIKSDIERIKNEKEKNLQSIDKKREEINLINVSLEAKSLELKIKQEEQDKISKILEETSQKMNEDEKKFKQISNDIVEKMQKASDLSNKITFYESSKTKLEEQNKNLLEEQAIYTSKLNEKTVRKLVLEKNIENILQEEKEIGEKINLLLTNFEKNKNELSKIQEDINDKEKIQIEQKNKQTILKELENDYEGYSNSVKIILKEKQTNDNLKGIYDAVGEVVSVPKKYETAIEIAFGSSIQNVITDTEEDAKKGISYLKKHKKGRATFLPISVIKSKTIKKDKKIILKEKGVLGIASELVTFDSLYKGIIENILGKTIIVDNVDNAISLAKKYDYAYKIVTLDGDTINTGGSLTGGSIGKKNSGIFSRNRQIKELSIKIEKLEKELEKQNLLANKKEEDNNNIEKDINEHREKLNNTVLEKTKINSDLKQAKEYIEEFEQKLKEIDINLKNTKIKLNESLLDSDNLHENLKTINHEIERLKINIKDFEQKIEQEKLNKDNILNKLNNLNMDIKDIQNYIQNCKENVQRIEKDIQSVEELNMRLETNAEYNIKKQIVANQDIEDIKDEIDKLKLDYDKIKKDIDFLQNEKIDFVKNVELISKDISKILESISQTKNIIVKLEAKKDSAENKIDLICENMWKDYEITYAGACNDYENLDKDLEALKKDEIFLKQEIAKLGNVNVSAIEEYKVLNERYNHNINQREDIIKADADLKDIIKTLVDEMEEQFKDQFYLINQNFGKVFSDIFGGGTAELVLSDKENILSSGIDIVARPPGKNLQSLSLLSGGERTLTAMCLLFAILILKPSPFCILDETEAALDDANVIRYANFLKKCAEDNQFILITHKTGTMEIADILYGVTMEEQGVSKVISVELKDAKEYEKI